MRQYIFCSLAAVLFLWSQSILAEETGITIESEGWLLKGDIQSVPSGKPKAFALLLHKVSGDRQIYTGFAEMLAEENIASLRIDLRGHGESTNLGAFDPEASRYYDENNPAVVRNFRISRSSDKDIVTTLNWIEAHEEFGQLPLVIVSGSYSGQEMTEASVEKGKFAPVNVVLAPGNFAASSIPLIDQSGVKWLFVRAEEELPFFPALFEAIDQGSENAEIWVLEGSGHATDILETIPGADEKLISWIIKSLE